VAEDAHVRHLPISLFVGCGLLVGCTRQAPVTEPPSALQPQATIREIMDAEVDPSADALWDSVMITITAAGEDDRQPRTAAEWQAVRRSAIVLIEATNLLVMPGRRVASDDSPLGPGELTPAAIQQRIDANRAEFAGFAQALRGVSIKALAAIDSKNADALLNVGSEIDEACEACHLVYWYPPGAAPKP